MTRLARAIAGRGSFYAAIIVLVTFAAFPFYWMLITTFKTDGDLYNLQSNPYWFNAAPRSSTCAISSRRPCLYSGCGTPH